jgi:hypothetical protein
MNTKEAKDFLLQESAEQAVLENVSLSDVERRMMYFTENDPASCDNPLELNQEFEAQYDTVEYEAKMSLLLDHAYDRLTVENPERKRMWDQAVGELRKGDHYFLVLWDSKAARERPKHDSLKLVGTAMLVVAGIGILVLLAVKYNIDINLGRYWKYASIVVFALILFGSGLVRALYRLAVAWFHRRTS